MRRPAPLAGLAGGVILFTIGFFPLLAQALLFRSFDSQFEGHEFAVGCFFGSWLAWLGAGGLLVRLAGRRAERLERLLPLLLLAYIPAFVVQHWLLTHARQLAGVQAYEFFPLARVLAFSLAANAPLSIVTGALFTLGCSWAGREHASFALARVYALESLGSFAGGAAVTIMLACSMEPEAAFGWAALFLCAAVCFHQAAVRSWRAGLAVLVLGTAAAAAIFFDAGGELAALRQAHAFARLLPGGRFSGSFTTPQGSYLFGTYRGQFNVIFGEAPCETVPDLEHASEVVAAHLAQKPDARSVLVIGPGSFAICQRFLDLGQVRSVTWLHTDPDYPARFLQVVPAGIRGNTGRLDAPALEIRASLEQRPAAYDLILVNLPDAASLSLSRYFTQEFFALAKRSLLPGGVLSVRVSGGENYLGGDLANLGASAYLGLQANFAKIALKPGDETWLLGSDTAEVSDRPDELAGRYAAVEGSSTIYPREGIDELYPADRIRFQLARYRSTIRKTPVQLLANTDARPRAMLNGLLLAAQQSGIGQRWSAWIKTAALSGSYIALAGFFIFIVLRGVYFFRERLAGSATVLAPSFLVFSTGLAGMAVSVTLMFLYQVRFGSLATHIGLLSALFMLGLFLGSRMTEYLLASRKGWSAPCILRWGVLVQLGFFALLARIPAETPQNEFWALLPATGVLTGIYVPIAGLCLRRACGLGDSASSMVFLIADNLGGALGGILAGLLLLPALGTAGTLLVLGLLLSANFFIFTKANFAPHAPAATTRLLRFARPAGYLMFGLAAFWLAASHIFHGTALEKKGPVLLGAAQAMLRDTGLRLDGPAEKQQQEPPYYDAKKPDGTRDCLVFNTADYGEPAYGYGGPVALAVRTDTGARVLDLRLLESRETPAYMARVRPWLATLAGRDLARENWSGIDAVSGATITSEAVLHSLRSAGPLFAARVLKKGGDTAAQPAPQPAKPDTGMLLFCLLAALGMVAHYLPRKALRRISLLLTACGAGLYLNAQFSLDQVFSLVGLKLPIPGFTLPFFICIGVPVLVLLVGNIYCGQLCPFGALQELIGELRPGRWLPDLPKDLMRYARSVKYVLLAAALVWFGTDLERGLSSADPLVTAFSRDALTRPSFFILLLLGLSFFFRRFWCRCLCPAGAFLSLLSGLRPFPGMAPRTNPARCDLGVRTARDFDCLHCGRCMIGERAPEPTRPRMLHLAFVLAAFTAALLLVQRGCQVNREWQAQQPAQAAAGSASEKEEHKAREANIPAIRKLIDRGELSSQEARHYKPYVPPPDEDE